MIFLSEFKRHARDGDYEQEFAQQLEILKVARENAEKAGKKHEAGLYLALAYMALEVGE